MEHLYPGETLETIYGHPTVYHYQPANNHDGPETNKPLIVCIPGALHLARIYYGGHKGSKPSDFLSYWLSQNGHPVLSISYPLETEPQIMPSTPTSASFRLPDWGRQAAMTTKKIIDNKELQGRPVILISWSMAGRMVVPFTIAANDLGLDVIQYISLAATPGFSSIRPPFPGIVPSSTGFFTVQARLENFWHQLLEMQDINGDDKRQVIPRDIYMREYVGATPIKLIGLGLRFDSNQKGFVEDEVPHEQDSRVLDIGNYPFVSALYPTSILDASHCLADRATWGFLLTYQLEKMVGKRGLRNVQGKGRGDETWQALTDLVHSAPKRLCLPVAGNHFFFVGEKAARDVAGYVERLIEEARAFQMELAGLVK